MKGLAFVYNGRHIYCGKHSRDAHCLPKAQKAGSHEQWKSKGLEHKQQQHLLLDEISVSEQQAQPSTV